LAQPWGRVEKSPRSSPFVAASRRRGPASTAASGVKGPLSVEVEFRVFSMGVGRFAERKIAEM
jgi:hypothetical protein